MDFQVELNAETRTKQGCSCERSSEMNLVKRPDLGKHPYFVRVSALFSTLFLVLAIFAQDKTPVFQGQPPVEIVNTETRPINKQKRQVFEFAGDGVYFSNDFEGARLNEITKTSENNYTILITPENAPINMSPWYAFKVWSKTNRDIFVKLTYPEFAVHRYSPQISRDGRKWKPLKSSRITEEEKGTAAFGARLALISLVCIGMLIFTGCLISARPHVKQVPDHFDPFAADAVCQKACMANAVEARRQDMDQETANELRRWQTHNLHPVTAFDAIVFPPESNGISIRVDKAVV